MVYQCNSERFRYSTRSAVCRAGWTLAAALALTACLGLGGCTADPAWPSLGKISSTDGAMTPEEQQKAIDAVKKAGRGQNGAAAMQPK
jgi:hypothetical protein